jgi:hypothetical protein
MSDVDPIESQVEQTELSAETELSGQNQTEVTGSNDQQSDFNIDDLSKEEIAELLRKEREEKARIAEEKAKAEYAFEKRLKKFTREKHAKNIVEEIKEVESKAPDRSQFTSDLEYYKALGAYEAEAKYQKQQKEKDLESIQAEAWKEYDDRSKSLEQFIPNHASVVNNLIQRVGTIPSDILEFAQDSDLGPIIMHHIGLNQEECNDLLHSTPRIRAEKLRTLEEHFARQLKQAGSGAQKPNVSKAPDPVVTTARGGAPVSVKGLRGDAFAENFRKLRETGALYKKR